VNGYQASSECRRREGWAAVTGTAATPRTGRPGPRPLSLTPLSFGILGLLAYGSELFPNPDTVRSASKNASMPAAMGTLGAAPP
jgi:hypothetical protein